MSRIAPPSARLNQTIIQKPIAPIPGPDERITMSTTLTGTFDSREQADMAVERLVQEIGIERTDIFVAASGTENSAGNLIGGADNETVDQAERDDVPLAGGITVSIDLQDEAKVEVVTAALEEFGAEI
jgi:hypothetical protein